MTIAALFGLCVCAQGAPVSAAEFSAAASTEYPVPVFHTPVFNTTADNAQMQQYADNGLANYLPFQTPGLTPGVVKPTAMYFPSVTTPVFLLGCDARSENWLLQHRTQLTQMHALGLIVQCDSQQDIERLQQLGQGITLVPTPAKPFVTRYGLTHYPVLITQEGLLQ